MDYSPVKHINFMKFFKPKYRIVADLFAGYEVQIKPWGLPFWFQIGINTFISAEHAQKFIENHKIK